MANSNRRVALLTAMLMSLMGCGRIGYDEVDPVSSNQGPEPLVDAGPGGADRDAVRQDAAPDASEWPESAALDSPSPLQETAPIEGAAVDSSTSMQDQDAGLDSSEVTAAESGNADAAADADARVVVDAGQETGPPCPIGCHCYTWSSHAYRFCPATMFRSAAEAQCEQWGMALVQVDDAQEQAFIELILAALPAQFAWWIGANDIAREGTWVWANGVPFWQELANGSPVGGRYNHWGMGEPNENGSEDCAAIYDHPDWMAANHWADTLCEENLSLICESY